MIQNKEPPAPPCTRITHTTICCHSLPPAVRAWMCVCMCVLLRQQFKASYGKQKAFQMKGWSCRSSVLLFTSWIVFSDCSLQIYTCASICSSCSLMVGWWCRNIRDKMENCYTPCWFLCQITTIKLRKTLPIHHQFHHKRQSEESSKDFLNPEIVSLLCAM